MSPMILLISLSVALIARGDVIIEAASLNDLPPGSVVHESIRALPPDDGGGVLFAEGGMELPVTGTLSAPSGTIDVEFRVPTEPRARDERALFFLEGSGGARISLMFGSAGLSALYRAEDGPEARIRYRAARLWEAGSPRRIRLSWEATDSLLTLMLSADGELLAVAEGAVIAELPPTCHIGARPDGAAWHGVIDRVVLSRQAVGPIELQPGERTIRVRADQSIGRSYSFWDFANINQPHRFEEPGYREELIEARPFISGVNLVYLMGGRWEGENEWYHGLDAEGALKTDFAGLITQLRNAMDKGFEIKVVLDKVPFAMSDPPEINHYGNTAPPADWLVWQDYVAQAVRAMIDAFGAETVSEWTFRVGTEPDLRPAHWTGTREEYFMLYDHSVAAVRSVLPEAKVGPGNILNPAAAEFGLGFRDQWGLDIIGHAAEGENTALGGHGVPMDFFSYSWYASVGAPLTVFDNAVEAVRSRLDRYPQFEDVWIEIGEFAVLRDEFSRRIYAGEITEWSASFYAALAERIYSHNVRQVYEWDHATSGVLHPRAQVIWMLEQMKDGELLAVEQIAAGSAARCGAVAVRKGDKLLILVYNHRPWRRPSIAETVRLEVVDPRMVEGRDLLMNEWSIDREKAVWAYSFEADCAAAGIEPVPGAGRYEGSPIRAYGEPGLELFLRNIEKYRGLSELPRTVADQPIPSGEGRTVLEFEMPGHSVRLIELSMQWRPDKR